MKLFTLIAGARPNFIKVDPIIPELNKTHLEPGISFMLVHTGQHYDEKMIETIFRELNIPEPDVKGDCGENIQLAFENEF